MNVSGEFTVNAPRDVVFRTLRDPTSFVRFVDGVSELKELDPTHYEANFETKVAYLKFKFNVTVEVTRMEEPSAIEAKIEEGLSPHEAALHAMDEVSGALVGIALVLSSVPHRQIDHHA